MQLEPIRRASSGVVSYYHTTIATAASRRQQLQQQQEDSNNANNNHIQNKNVDTNTTSVFLTFDEGIKLGVADVTSLKINF